MADHEHSDLCTPDNCFRAKMRYRRTHGTVVRFGVGTSPASPQLSSAQLFHESTLANEQRKMVAMNDHAGNTIEKLSSRRELI